MNNIGENYSELKGEFMKYILVQVGPIAKYPPALMVLQDMDDLGYDITLITNQIDENTKKICENRNIKYVEILKEFPENISPLIKFKRMIQLRSLFWKEINEIYDEETIIWVSSDAAIMHLGSRLLKTNYILHMYELGESIIYYSKLPFLKMNTSEYARRALAVIQAEYNRAHIAKTWWNLEKLPSTLPNKPYDNGIEKKSAIQDETARKTLEKLKDKKIILYQGITSNERPLDGIIKAVNSLGDEYAFVLMSSEDNVYSHLKVSNFYFIPFVKPPYHLEITSHAHIGVLSYTPTSNGYSKLNALFCAPNKIYEYASFGIPMIGNDIPGLSYPFETNGIGEIFASFDEKDILESIKKIETGYENYQKSAYKFYEDTDTKEIISEVLEIANNKISNRRKI